MFFPLIPDQKITLAKEREEQLCSKIWWGSEGLTAVKI
jgi:hypothetical protein